MQPIPSFAVSCREGNSLLGGTLMAKLTVRRVLFLFLSVFACLALLFWAGGNFARQAELDNVFALMAPPFVSVAHAQDAAPGGMPASIFDGEAGIAAYFRSPSAITLATVVPLYRTIETQTAQYIVGSIPVPDYPESEDVHLYIHTDGWVMAYYLKADPTGKIFDWRIYTGGTTIPTKLERVLGLVVSQIGIVQPAMTFYHFQYPNATHMLLVADQAPTNSGDSFQVNPTSAYAYLERSWALGCFGSLCNYVLDGTQIASTGSATTSQGLLSPSQLMLDQFHTVSVTDGASPADLGLALIYRVP